MKTFMTKDGTLINYEVTGNGSPLVMIHGISGNLMMFKDNVERLQNHFQVVTYDIRGHGHSDRPLNYMMEDHIEDCIQLIDHLGLEQVNLLGYSMGSYIALGVITEHPERVQRLMLVGAKSHGEVSSFAKLMIEHREEIKGMKKDEAQQVLAPYIYHDVEKVSNWMKPVKQYYELTEDEEAIASRSIAGFDYREKLEYIRQPVILISGCYDGLNPPIESKWIAEKVQDGRVIDFPLSGHAPMVEEQEHFEDIVIQFLG